MDCHEPTTLSYTDFSRRLFDAAGMKRLPISMEIEFTHHCNVRCVHCYVPETHRTKSTSRPEMSGDEIRRFFDEAAEMGVLWLLITGGEPLLRPDFVDLYLYAKRRGFLITLFTNGTTVTDDIADVLADYPPFAVEVTVHSMDPQIYESVTCVPGSFDRCIAGVQRLADRGLSLRLKSVAMQQNRCGVDDVAAFAKDLGAEYRFDPHIMARTDGGGDPLEVRLSPEEVVALDFAHNTRMDAWSQLLDESASPNAERIFSCGAGIRSFHVNAFAQLSACGMTQYLTYDLRAGSLRDGWDGFIPSVIGRRADPGYVCGGCERMILCGRCPGWAYTEVGDEQALVPYLCELADVRARAIEQYRATADENTRAATTTAGA